MKQTPHVQKPLHMDSRIAKVMQDVEVLQEKVKVLEEKVETLIYTLIEYSKSSWQK